MSFDFTNRYISMREIHIFFFKIKEEKQEVIEMRVMDEKKNSPKMHASLRVECQNISMHLIISQMKIIGTCIALHMELQSES